jgi:hypothetical protein
VSKDRFEKLATFDELDKENAEVGRLRDEAAEQGAFDETGGTLGRADWEDARANS